ncbi:tetratricopeptide repeat protein [Streptomyces sp. NA04227]|uniref:tetratricopeptide repeat protein n=1 Tax=Streptomyces sp. NA04227 TaxID=2742136 RepID=UPI001591678E|nr:tetratricopeptide repeat protein [Streptomyces sp. NA04227]QKW07600.1 tetratricopeptide repeat protein [Streptomyces sp. NA04227]
MGIFRRDRRTDANRDADAELAFERGTREFRAGRYAEAATHLGDAVKLAPNSPEAQFLLGAALFNVGKSKAAIGPLRRCLTLRPEHAEGLFALGMALGRTGELDTGLAHISKAASLGEPKALEMLPQLGADYCRACTRPAHYAKGDTSASILVMGPNIGMSCESCRTVLCGPCARRDRFGPMVLNCPDCEGPLAPLSRN